MARSLMIPTNRRPTTPGEMLLEEFLKPLKISQTDFAKRIGVSYPRLSQIIHGHRGVTPDTALRLSKVTGTTPGFWLNLQQMVDLYDAIHSPAAKKIDKLKPIKELVHA